MQPYGFRVLGKEGAAAAVVSQKTSRRYGDKVLGSSVDESEDGQEKRDGQPARGQRAGVPPDTSGLDALATKYATDDGYLSITDVKTILAEMPEAFERVLGWEMGREDGPRIGALAHFIEVETARKGGARPNILKNLETALVAVRTKNKG